ncbi:hypothetical protein WBG78_26500 [Chryseolinea sp. T2]|uniref:hypothetical protein n=1 Tax=Chryseolinea sp. T2 TaxID=3129255 RepID=UPI003076F660
MKLSNNQIEIIRAQIARSIQIQSLQDDVLDHVCCALEEHDELEGEFEVAVQSVVKELAPDGLPQMQRDTLLLLNIKHIVMKKFLYSLGLVTAMSSSMGLCFKILHLKGADFLLTWGLLAFTLLYLPAQVILWYRTNENVALAEKLKIVFALLSGLITGGAIILRFARFDSSAVDMTFVAGAAIFSFGFLPIQFFNLYKKEAA